jgi:hypothetical protein
MVCGYIIVSYLLLARGFRLGIFYRQIQLSRLHVERMHCAMETGRYDLLDYDFISRGKETGRD